MNDREKQYHIEPFTITVFPTISENLEVVYGFKIFFTAVEFDTQQNISTCIFNSPSVYLSQNTAIESAIKYIDVMLLHQMDCVDRAYDELFPNKI